MNIKTNTDGTKFVFMNLKRYNFFLFILCINPLYDICHVFQTPFGLIRMTVVVVPFLYVGTLISKNFAALLEEHDIFVPEDDDDDD